MKLLPSSEQRFVFAARRPSHMQQTHTQSCSEQCEEKTDIFHGRCVRPRVYFAADNFSML